MLTCFVLTAILSLPLSAQSLSRVAGQSDIGTSLNSFSSGEFASSSGEFAAELPAEVFHSAVSSRSAEAGATPSTRSSLAGTISKLVEAQKRYNAAELVLRSYGRHPSNVDGADSIYVMDLLSNARDFLDWATTFEAGDYAFQVDVLQMRWMLRIQL